MEERNPIISVINSQKQEVKQVHFVNALESRHLSIELPKPCLKVDLHKKILTPSELREMSMRVGQGLIQYRKF